MSPCRYYLMRVNFPDNADIPYKPSHIILCFFLHSTFPSDELLVFICLFAQVILVVS